MTEKWQSFNVNNKVRVRITEFGFEILRKERDKLQRLFPHVDWSFPHTDFTDVGNGWYETQMWQLMQTFGPHITMGFKVPFETNVLISIEEN